MKYNIISFSRNEDRVSFIVECQSGTFCVKGTIENDQLVKPYYDGKTQHMFEDIYDNKDKRELLKILREEWASISLVWTES